MTRVATWAGWVFGSTVLAGLALHPWVGDELFVARYVGYVMPWLLVGLVPGAVWAWRVGLRGLPAVLAVSAAIIVVLEVRPSRRPPAIPSPAVRLTVVSYNTWSSNHDEGRIARVVLDHAPDILLLQEIRADVFARLIERLGDLYGGRTVSWAYEPTLMQGIVSRYPVESRASMKEKGQAQKVVLRSPAGPVTVFNLHPLRHGGWRKRYDEVASLLEEDVRREKGPVILGGDLNAPEHSQLYTLLAADLENAHRRAGSGFGFTYPSPAVRLLGLVPAPSVVRIDHIFFSDHFVALRAGTLDESGGSDHRPVFAELALRAAAPRDP
jgi:endonuclease/exonuclease/phosphatase (EEP) superfamily protein YafD